MAQIAPEAANNEPEKAAILMSLYEPLNARKNGQNASAPAPASPTAPTPLVSIEEELGLVVPPPAPGQPAPEAPSGGGASEAFASLEQPASDPYSIVDASNGTESPPAAAVPTTRAPIIDPLAAVKEKAAQELFGRIGSRLNDTSLTEDAAARPRP